MQCAQGGLLAEEDQWAESAGKVPSSPALLPAGLTPPLLSPLFSKVCQAVKRSHGFKSSLFSQF